MSNESYSPQPEETKNTILSDHERGKLVRFGIREIRALKGIGSNSNIILGNPKTESAWMVDPRTFNGSGIRISIFNSQIGTMEMISVTQSQRKNMEVDGIIKRVTIPSQILWQDLSGESTIVEENTLIAGNNLLTAIENLKSITKK